MGRPVRIVGDIAFVPLTLGLEAIIDASDAKIVEGYPWAARRSPRAVYAQANITNDGARATVILHRLLLSAPPGALVDHRDGDGLNNRRSNLRLCGYPENGWNRAVSSASTSGIKGVSWIAKDRRWSARIRAGAGVRVHLGNFLTKEEAAAAYAEAARKYHGEFALAVSRGALE